jgi:hypothetical protein
VEFVPNMVGMLREKEKAISAEQQKLTVVLSQVVQERRNLRVIVQEDMLLRVKQVSLSLFTVHCL